MNFFFHVLWWMPLRREKHPKGFIVSSAGDRDTLNDKFQCASQSGRGAEPWAAFKKKFIHFLSPFGSGKLREINEKNLQKKYNRFVCFYMEKLYYVPPKQDILNVNCQATLSSKEHTGYTEYIEYIQDI